MLIRVRHSRARRRTIPDGPLRSLYLGCRIAGRDRRLRRHLATPIRVPAMTNASSLLPDMTVGVKRGVNPARALTSLGRATRHGLEGIGGVVHFAMRTF